MDYKQHLILGTLFSGLFVIYFNWLFGWYNFELYSIIQMFLIIALGSLLPDFDHRISKLQNWFMTIGLSISLIGVIFWILEIYINYKIIINFEVVNIMILGILISSITFFNTKISKHRGFWHTISMGIIYGVIITLLTYNNYELGVLGFFSYWIHLLLDGIPLKMR